MLSMLKEAENADVIFKTKDGQEIKAHKLILAAHSVVLNTMFFESEKKDDGIVELPDIGSEGLKIFLKYIYTGDVEFSDCYDVIINAADKYQVQQHFKDVCDQKLMAMLRTGYKSSQCEMKY